MNPHQYNRRILLAVTGLSPQVVTETLYALARKHTPAFVPTEIHVITTGQGAAHARLNLLSDEPGWFHRLRQEYALPAIVFDDSTLHIVTDAAGQPLDDIRTPTDNERVADSIAETVRDLTADPDAAVHVSLAGGRKTMGYYLGYALSLYGRPQDCLSHVLVSSPFESHPEFYYPTREQRVIQTREAKPRPLDCRDAVVELAEIPFVRMRHGLDDRLREGTTTFSASVAAAQRALGPAELVLDLKNRRIRVADQIIVPPPAELALLAVFARRAARTEPALPSPSKGVPDSEWSQRYLDELRLIVGDMADCDRTEQTLKKGMDDEYFSTHKSKLHKLLHKTLGPAAKPYLIDDGGTRPRRYRLALAPEAIRFADLMEQDARSLKETV
jgi:CRISPR-associated protein (TIGR02584 family)